MFEYIVASLSPNTATEIRDLILTPPAENQYTILKEQLIQRTATSQQQRIQQLLTAEEVGDRKPTQFLHRLQQLAGDTVRQDSVFIQELFLRLPANVYVVLASTNEHTPIAQLAQSVQPSSTALEQLQGEIASLPYNKPDVHKCHAVVHRAHTIIPQTEVILPQCPGTIRSLVMMPRSTDLFVLTWKTTRPATDGNQCPWLSTLLPILHY